MKKDIPAWALRIAGPEDQDVVRDSRRQGGMRIKWPDRTALQGWASQHGWPAPQLGFEQAFITMMLETRESYTLAIHESGIEIRIPKRDYTISLEKLRELDALYEQRSAPGRPSGWGDLVEELREIRRAVEAGVVLKVEGAQMLASWGGLYDWAHGRYHMLEDGYDRWIGDDRA